MDGVTYVVWYKDAVESTDKTIKRIGGKALGLHELRYLGINVPIWATITTDLFRILCESDKKLGQLLSEKRDDLEKAKKLSLKIIIEKEFFELLK